MSSSQKNVQMSSVFCSDFNTHITQKRQKEHVKMAEEDMFHAQFKGKCPIIKESYWIGTATQQ